MGFEVVQSFWEAPWPVRHGWISLNIKYVIYVRQFSASLGTGCKYLEVQTESWVRWRPDGKENVLEVEVDLKKTKYMFMSQDQNAGRIHHIKIDIISFERAEEIK